MPSRYTVISIDLADGPVTLQERRIDFRRIYALNVPGPVTIRVDSPSAPAIPVLRPGLVWEDCGALVERIYVTHAAGAGVVELFCSDEILVDPSGAGGESSGVEICRSFLAEYDASSVFIGATTGDGGCIETSSTGSTGEFFTRGFDFGSGIAAVAAARVAASANANCWRGWKWGGEGTAIHPDLQMFDLLNYPSRPEVGDYWLEFRATVLAQLTIASGSGAIEAFFGICGEENHQASGNNDCAHVGFKAIRGSPNWHFCVNPGDDVADVLQVDLGVSWNVPRRLTIRAGRAAGAAYFEVYERGNLLHRYAPSSSLGAYGALSGQWGITFPTVWAGRLDASDAANIYLGFGNQFVLAGYEGSP